MCEVDRVHLLQWQHPVDIVSVGHCFASFQPLVCRRYLEHNVWRLTNAIQCIFLSQIQSLELISDDPPSSQTPSRGLILFPH